MSDGRKAITRICFKVQLQVRLTSIGRKRLKILNLKCNTLPRSMNIWAEQARRLASELTMKSKIEIKQRNRDGGTGQFIYDLPMVFQ